MNSASDLDLLVILQLIALFGIGVLILSLWVWVWAQNKTIDKFEATLDELRHQRLKEESEVQEPDSGS